MAGSDPKDRDLCVNSANGLYSEGAAVGAKVLFAFASSHQKMSSDSDEEVEVTPAQQKEPNPSPVKKRRGRPSNASKGIKPATQSKKRGRPAKAKAETGKAKTPPKKRGTSKPKAEKSMPVEMSMLKPKSFKGLSVVEVTETLAAHQAHDILEIIKDNQPAMMALQAMHPAALETMLDTSSYLYPELLVHVQNAR
ncbi:hypothetical protein WJX72_009005 [[Myrmecia] bisecta]|uniref:Uncharacterized protein n=1 Tax=[Myrmecia] bisecta TaxID=41462 RepID=A0AAW1PH34_9CHLO